MNPKNPSNTSLDATRAPLVTKIFSIIALLFALGAIAYPVLGFLFMPRLETVITLQDFESQADCFDYVNQHLPVPLPEGAIVSSFELVSWQDWTLDATVNLPSGSALEYVNSVQDLNTADASSKTGHASTTNSASFTTQGEFPMSGSVSYDEGSRLLSIHCSNLP